MPELKRESVESYLQRLLGKPVTVSGFSRLGDSPEEKSVKSYGYGTPVRVKYSDSQQDHSAVLHTMRAGRFGHEHMSDRAQVLLWEHEAFNRLPRHVRSLDVGGFTRGGALVSLSDVEELFLLTDYVEGEGYFLDLERLEAGGKLTPGDLERVAALSNYLVGIHKVPGSDPGLYIRRIRELVGHGECIMGIADSFPPEYATMLEEIEELAVKWRWKLKNYTHRLRQVHGDFHPWNILFCGADLWVLDRSRGEYGDPADDVSSITLNYVFSSLQISGRLEGAFATLFERFWDVYLEKSGDREMLEVVAPFFAFRGLVMASPVWFPSVPPISRQRLFSFMRAVLEAERFDPTLVNQYCGA